MTATNSTSRRKTENPFDEENSLISYTIYHERPVNHHGGKSQKYYLKKKLDREHDAAGTEEAKMVLEIKRSNDFIESKLKARYADNRMTSIQIYFNDNRGGTIPETAPNPLLCQLNILSNGDFKTKINLEIIATDESLEFVNEILETWKSTIQRLSK